MHPLRVANNKFSKNLGKNFFRSRVPLGEQKKMFFELSPERTSAEKFYISHNKHLKGYLQNRKENRKVKIFTLPSTGCRIMMLPTPTATWVRDREKFQLPSCREFNSALNGMLCIKNLSI
jgi:hypothetical protein